MNKHTPGPWSVRYTSTQDGKGGHCSVSIYRSAKNIVAKRVQGRLTVEDEANAALIAAAPDMLKALEAIASGLENDARLYPDGQFPSVRRFKNRARTARIAIAKARGEA